MWGVCVCVGGYLVGAIAMPVLHVWMHVAEALWFHAGRRCKYCGAVLSLQGTAISLASQLQTPLTYPRA